MRKYHVFENVLNEYVNHPTQVLLQEIEAESAEEAVKIVRMMHPDKGVLTVDGRQHGE